MWSLRKAAWRFASAALQYWVVWCSLLETMLNAWLVQIV